MHGSSYQQLSFLLLVLIEIETAFSTFFVTLHKVLMSFRSLYSILSQLGKYQSQCCSSDTQSPLSLFSELCSKDTLSRHEMMARGGLGTLNG